jgi:hypothetical protein
MFLDIEALACELFLQYVTGKLKGRELCDGVAVAAATGYRAEANAKRCLIRYSRISICRSHPSCSFNSIAICSAS